MEEAKQKKSEVKKLIFFIFQKILEEWKKLSNKNSDDLLKTLEMMEEQKKLWKKKMI